MDSLRSTWNSINQFAKAHRTEDGPEGSLEDQVDSQMSSVMKELDDDQSCTCIYSTFCIQVFCYPVRGDVRSVRFMTGKMFSMIELDDDQYCRCIYSYQSFCNPIRGEVR